MVEAAEAEALVAPAPDAVRGREERRTGAIGIAPAGGRPGMARIQPRVAVCDGQALIRAGVASVLRQRQIDVVAEAADLGELLEVIAERHPDLVLLDPMSVAEGMDAVRLVRAADPAVVVVVLTSSVVGAQVSAAVDAGVGGYLLKDVDGEELARAVRVAARGEVPLSPEVATVVVRRQAIGREVMFTPREEAALALLAEGLPNKQIALRLGVSERTVKAHLSEVFKRIGVSDRTQAALWFLRTRARTRAS